MWRGCWAARYTWWEGSYLGGSGQLLALYHRGSVMPGLSRRLYLDPSHAWGPLLGCSLRAGGHVLLFRKLLLQTPSRP